MLDLSSWLLINCGTPTGSTPTLGTMKWRVAGRNLDDAVAENNLAREGLDDFPEDILQVVRYLVCCRTPLWCVDEASYKLYIVFIFLLIYPIWFSHQATKHRFFLPKRIIDCIVHYFTA